LDFLDVFQCNEIYQVALSQSLNKWFMSVVFDLFPVINHSLKFPEIFFLSATCLINHEIHEHHVNIKYSFNWWNWDKLYCKTSCTFLLFYLHPTLGIIFCFNWINYLNMTTCKLVSWKGGVCWEIMELFIIILIELLEAFLKLRKVLYLIFFKSSVTHEPPHPIRNL
jgi:hypothetical protein